MNPDKNLDQSSASVPSTARKPILFKLFIVVYLIFLCIPAFIFFSTRQGFSFLQGADSKTLLQLIFPLFGLYAFFLVWTQLILGSNMSLLRKISPNFDKFHRTQGVFALLFAITHPSLLIFSIGFPSYLKRDFIDPALTIYFLAGNLALYLMIVTVATALLRKSAFLRNKWRYIHYSNYLIFFLVLIHSWFLGSDVQTTALKYLWIFFGLTALTSTVARLIRQVSNDKPKIATSTPTV